VCFPLLQGFFMSSSVLFFASGNTIEKEIYLGLTDHHLGQGIRFKILLFSALGHPRNFSE